MKTTLLTILLAAASLAAEPPKAPPAFSDQEKNEFQKARANAAEAALNGKIAVEQAQKQADAAVKQAQDELSAITQKMFAKCDAAGFTATLNDKRDPACIEKPKTDKK